jgi:hypothetical protein
VGEGGGQEKRGRGCRSILSSRFVARTQEVSMEAPKCYIFEHEGAVAASDGAPSKGPTYRSIYAKDGFPELPEGLATTWDLFE